ncbi:hypothetical protein AGMMS49587_13090 [Spirochaetia bacterium]|nr:hypothetical protein AGMMS49587_13090 [Spirochaetia bacterium]
MQYTIKEISRIFGNTVGGIRFYEEAGLVNPDRNQSDNRVYTTENIQELFYLRKYCTFGLKIREVAEYFTDQNTKDIQEINRLLKIKAAESEQKALFYQQAAQWTTNYNEKLSRLDEYLDHFIPEGTPDFLLLMDESLVSNAKPHQDAARRWIAAAPMSRISMITHFEKGRIKDSRPVFLINKAIAESLQLPQPPYTRLLKGASCMYTIVKVKSTGFDFIGGEIFAALIKKLEAAGHVFSGMAISNIVFTHKIRGEQYKYFEMWFPVDTELPLIV